MRDKAVTKEVSDRLHDQLVKLGDMIGDGLHLEPDGKWIAKEYRKVARALGYGAPRASNAEAINKAMAEAVERCRCRKCGGQLQQTKSGSLRAACASCGTKYQFKRSKASKD